MDSERIRKKSHRKKSTGSLQDIRSHSVGSRRLPRNRDVSRESSTGSSAVSLDVRCACQYYQSDALLPDRISLVGRKHVPIIRINDVRNHFVRDHEYEPVNPPEEVTYLSSPSPTEPTSDQDANRVLPSTTELENSTLQFQDPKRNDEPVRGPAMFHFHTDDEEPDTTAANEVPTPKEPKSPGKFQVAFKHKTDQLKTKLHNIKRPHITLPNKPNFQKPDFKKFKIDTSKITMPAFHLPGKSGPKKPLNERQLSTESNAGDSTKKPLFNFGTYPRIFTKKNKSQRKKDLPGYATTPRKSKKDDDKWRGSDSIRIPLHSEDSMDVDSEVKQAEEERRREESLERRMREDNQRYSEERDEPPSHIRYEDHPIDIEDEYDEDYQKENQEIHQRAQLNERWAHGSFVSRPTEFEENLKNARYKVTDLDSPEDQNENVVPPKDRYSSEGSVEHRPGVLEQIDSDEFFLRQKGISQEYLSSELREAFRTPVNALTQMQGDFDRRGSNQSLPEVQTKRKPIKKPKRKKTPHVSQEKINYDEESLEEHPLDGLPPARPRRKSKRTKKKETDNVVPYQETIPLDDDVPDGMESHPDEYIRGERLKQPRESLGILGDDEREEIDFDVMYENEGMEGKEQPEIKVTDPYKQFEFVDTTRFYQPQRDRELETGRSEPAAPPRKHRSLKSLTVSENGSLAGYPNNNRNEMETSDVLKRIEDYIIPPEEAPIRPKRTRSQGSSLSQTTPYRDESPQREEQALPLEEYYPQEGQEPCVEEPCIQDIRDYMGYAIIDKTKVRDPPLPPPRTPPRRKRSIRSTTASSSSPRSEEKFSTIPKMSTEVDVRFSTVPRLSGEKPPVRPLRNYSTLASIKNRPDPTYENKENIDITQYIELEDDVNRNLNSGDVIQKMRDRPLPPPPRPPRKSKNLRQSLQDITSHDNVMKDPVEAGEKPQNVEENVSTQTEPLPDDFECENEQVTVERRLITPTHYTYEEETVTHAALVVEPLDGAKVVPDSQLSRERIVPVSQPDSDEETSLIPEEFAKLKNPEPEVVKTQKLQVTDLDVDRLTVNQLMANKIIVSEIDSGAIQTSEITSKTGTITLGNIELPPQVVKEIADSLQAARPSPSEEKKTPIETEQEPPVLSQTVEEESTVVHPPESLPSEPESPQSEPPQPPPRSFSSTQEDESPQRPPRQTSRPRDEPLEPEVDDEAPPRPPQPHLEYLPSQPPASFYSLRAQKYVETIEDIPVVPRRRKHQRSRPISRSRSSSESSVTPANSRRLRRYSDPSIPELTGRLVRACGSRVNNQLKRLIRHLTENVLRNADGQQDLHVMMIILLVLIAGLILLGYGEEKTVVHLHHWEYFNPPKDM